MISDQCHLACSIDLRPHQENPKFRFVKNWSKCTLEALRVEVLKSEPLETLYKLKDPEIIANVLSNKFNCIIDKISPQKRVVVERIYQPFLTGELRDEIAHSNNFLTIAIKQGGKDNWRNYRNFGDQP